MKRNPRPLEVKEPALSCEMPLTKSASCGECRTFGLRAACPLGHMQICRAPVWVSCTDCDRVLCWEHIHAKCYCKSQLVGVGGAAERERAREREREIARAREEREREREWC